MDESPFPFLPRPLAFNLGSAVTLQPLHVAFALVQPHYHRVTSGLTESVTAQERSPLDAFNGTIHRTKTGLLYSAGLAIVAFAMVLLPFLYLALIVAAVWLVVLHLRYDTWMLGTQPGERAGFYRFALYLSPMVAGGILVFFMVKPFFAGKRKSAQPITLDPAKEPLLFGFVHKVCGLVGAPAPCRIDIDCDVNASARLRCGLFSRDLVLTVGLPLVAGLDMRQFAGVLAHEFGHFAQGAGMRLTYIIRRINHWFARVVFERDEWDAQLEASAKSGDWRVLIVLNLARGCVWATRRILAALMHAGHAISCFMLRQMEYDADSYEAKLAGSDAFEQTASKLRLLNVATQAAYAEVQQCWASKRLPEDLPLLIRHKAGVLPAEIHEKLSTAASSEKTGWFDTHPCDADRVRAARRLKEPGVFRLTDPATRLFSDFAELSKTATRHQYTWHMQLEFTDQNLMPAEEILRESAAHAEAQAMIRKFYGEVNISLKPLLTAAELPPLTADENPLAQWRKARETNQALRGDAEEIAAQWVGWQKHLAKLTTVYNLARAGFKVQPEEFGLPQDATTPGEQEKAAAAGLQAAKSAIAEHVTALDPFMDGLRRRVTLALQLVLANGSVLSRESASEVIGFARLVAAVGEQMPRVHRIASQLGAFALLAQNCNNHSNPAQVDSVASELATEFQSLVREMQQRLKAFSYPFPHARGPLTVAEYARFEGSADNNWVRAYLDGNAHVDRIFALNYRLIGRLLAHVDAAEASLQKT